ncbi:MAG: type I 3-dehydroquinate dehydratase [Treponema sp.]|nr:type I 3-dehydroquinate dehydratase [Treponema sp.]
MNRPLICMTLTCKTLNEDLELIKKYRNHIDIVELRADYLSDDEKPFIKKFPGMAGLPCILTIRRKIDGGVYSDGEAARAVIFAKALSFVAEDQSKNFAYVDFEEDFQVSSLQDAALAYGVKVIRSLHDMNNPIGNLAQRLEKLKVTDYEIPKIAFMPETLQDVKHVFDEASKLKDSNHIIVAMGPLGLPTRVLSAKIKNYLTFTSPTETMPKVENLGHIDPVTLNEVYHFKSINEDTRVYGITGYPLLKTSSPEIHNAGYLKHEMNAVYIPICSKSFKDVLDFADSTEIMGMSVTIPHKESVLEEISDIEKISREIGACNTIVRTDGKWKGYNTDVTGFSKSLLEFLGEKNLAHKKVAIIGAGGAAKAIAYAVKQLKGKACIFNRTIVRAQELANKYDFKAEKLDRENLETLKKYSDVIIQTTSVGMNSMESSSQENDPLYFYEFTGNEKVFDIIYVPAVTPLMARAAKAGCKVCNGYDMLRYQGYEQFRLFTDNDY